MTSVRSRLMAVVAVSVAAVMSGLAFEALLSLDKVTPFGHTGMGMASAGQAWSSPCWCLSIRFESESAPHTDGRVVGFAFIW